MGKQRDKSTGWFTNLIWAIIAGLTTTAVVVLVSHIAKPKEVITIDYDGSIVVAYNNRLDMLWRNDIGSKIARVSVQDIDQDGRNEVILGTTHRGKDPGSILLLDGKGRILWKFNTYPVPFPYLGVHSGRFTVKDLLVDDLYNDGDKEIIALGHDPQRYVCRIVVVNKEGRLFGEYFHPGELSQVTTTEMLPNGRKAIISGGCNKDLRRVIEGSNDYENYYGLFLIDSKAIWGHALPCLDLRSYSREKWVGSEKWYRVVLPQGRSITSFEVVKERSDSRPIINVIISDGRFFSLSLDGKIVAREISDDWIKEHRGEDPDTFPLIDDILK